MILPSTTQPQSPNFQLSIDEPGKVVTDRDATRQSIVIILLTEPGSDVMRPDFGVGVHSMIGRPLGTVRNDIRRRLRQQMEAYLPGAEITKVAVTAADIPAGHLTITVEWREATGDGSATINI